MPQVASAALARPRARRSNTAHWHAFITLTSDTAAAFTSEAGISPRLATSLLAQPKREAKKLPPAVCAPSLPLRGNLRQPASGVRRVTRCALAALHSNRRGESVHEAGCVLRHSQPPQRQAVAGAAKRGKSGTGAGADSRQELRRNMPLRQSAGAQAAIKSTAELSRTRIGFPPLLTTAATAPWACARLHAKCSRIVITFAAVV